MSAAVNETVAVPAAPVAAEGRAVAADGRARARRVRAAVSTEGAARGASDEELARPAAAFLGTMPWQGPSPDPDVLDAATFLAWL